MRYQRLTKSLMASLALAIFITAPAAAQMDDRQAMMDLVMQVQQLQDEVRTLRGMLEEQTMELESLSNRQRDQYLDLDQRLNSLRGSAPEPAVSTSGAVTTPVYNNAPPATQMVVEDVPEVRPALVTPSAATGISTPDVQVRSIVASPENEKAAYDQAFQSLKDRKYADSAEQFQGFLNQYPNSSYADNAQYWLGESYYVTRNYEIALEAFRDLLEKFPDSPKVADGLLKIGYTHYELKQWDLARAALVQVQEQYPDTTSARLAGSRLRSMKIEGHY